MISTLEICSVLLLLFNYVASDIPRLRGVEISKAALYVSKNDEFLCLDGKKTIKYSQLNDDFCDCSDASDEPGTSACTNGRFHCTNAGHKPLTIPSSMVNDGICDCCDAADEYASSVQCSNNCMELGKVDRLMQKHKAELSKNGNLLRLEMSKKGKLFKEDLKVRLAELEKSRLQAEALKQEKLAIKTELELAEDAALGIYRQAEEADKKIREEMEAQSNRQEAMETFKKYDSNNNGLVEIIELQTRVCFDKNRNGMVEDEEAKYFLDENDKLDLESFITLGWPRIKPFLMMDSGLFKPPVSDLDTEKTEEHIDEDGEENDDAELTNQDEEDLHEDEEEYDPELPEEEVGEGSVEPATIDSPKPDYDPETQKLIDEASEARNQYSDAEREFREIESELSKIQESMQKDFGSNEEFAPLNGECFNYEDREYIYKVCPFDKAVQSPKNGGAETRLGTWDSWKGTDYRQMLFANGASCWNGPSRSALIFIECGLDTRVLSVTEPNRCEYQMQMQTPAACVASTTTDNEEHQHDEF